MAWECPSWHGMGNVHLLYTLTLPTHECLNGPAYLAGSGIQQCAWAISVPLHECLDCIDAPDTLSSIRRAQREKVLLQGDGCRDDYADWGDIPNMHSLRVVGPMPGRGSVKCVGKQPKASST